jgi:hypothetical protein
MHDNVAGSRIDHHLIGSRYSLYVLTTIALLCLVRESFFAATSTDTKQVRVHTVLSSHLAHLFALFFNSNRPIMRTCFTLLLRCPSYSPCFCSRYLGLYHRGRRLRSSLSKDNTRQSSLGVFERASPVFENT